MKVNSARRNRSVQKRTSGVCETGIGTPPADFFGLSGFRLKVQPVCEKEAMESPVHKRNEDHPSTSCNARVPRELLNDPKWQTNTRAVSATTES